MFIQGNSSHTELHTDSYLAGHSLPSILYLGLALDNDNMEEVQRTESSLILYLHAAVTDCGFGMFCDICRAAF